MGAPTWPPTPDEGYKVTMEEYGVSKAQLGLEEEDEAAERALLAHFLFANPKLQLSDASEPGLPLAFIQKRLHAWLRMITGLSFELGCSDPASTDGKKLFLPKALPPPMEPWGDELLFRCMGLVQLGFIQGGFLEQRSTLAEIHRDWVLRSVYHALAARWVIRQWRERYPGIDKDFAAVEVMEKAGLLRVNTTVVPRDGIPLPFLPLYQGLTVNLNWPDPGEQASAAREAVRRVDAAPADPNAARVIVMGQAQKLRAEYRRLRLGPPPLPFFLGVIRPEWILADLTRDLAYEQEWRKGNKPLRQLAAAVAGKRDAIPAPETEQSSSGGRGLRARLKSRFLRRREEKPSLSQMPAYGALRDEYQEEQRSGPKAVRYGAAQWKTARPEDIVTNQIEAAPEEDGGREYDEWSYTDGVYKMAATKVFTPDGVVGALSGYDKVVEANRRQIQQIRKRFEALRVEERWEGRQPDGPELDLNAAIQTFTDIAAGHQPKENFYRRFVRRRKDVCVMTLVDLSGSTQGRVLHAQQEAVILFSEGLKILGMPHAFYGFNSNHPEECYLYRLKAFNDPYDELTRKRLGNLRAQGATRLGALLRHASWILSQRPQARKVMILLSDGKPEDRNEYRGNYGIKDSAMAVSEAQRSGIHVHCISMDESEDAIEYLEEIFGPGRFLQVPNVDALPLRLPEVFRGLVD